jgi:hypothetical protein
MKKDNIPVRIKGLFGGNASKDMRKRAVPARPGDISPVFFFYGKETDYTG